MVRAHAAWTRTKELLNLLYRSVRPDVVVTVNSLLTRFFFRFRFFFRWTRSRLRMSRCNRTGSRLRARCRLPRRWLYMSRRGRMRSRLLTSRGRLTRLSGGPSLFRLRCLVLSGLVLTGARRSCLVLGGLILARRSCLALSGSILARTSCGGLARGGLVLARAVCGCLVFSGFVLARAVCSCLVFSGFVLARASCGGLARGGLILARAVCSRLVCGGLILARAVCSCLVLGGLMLTRARFGCLVLVCFTLACFARRSLVR